MIKEEVVMKNAFRTVFFVCLSLAAGACAQGAPARSASDQVQIVRAILDSAGWKDVTVESVSTVDSMGRILTLDLTNKEMGKSGIKSLPTAIGTLSSLTSLHLDKNDLTEIPMEIGFLRSLNDLDLQYNQLKELPASISNLTALASLDLRSNEISELPIDFYTLKSLKILKLTGNRLTSIPEEIGRLTSLKEAYLSNNRLKSLPRAIVRMKTITYVDFQDNTICAPNAELAAWMKKWDDQWKSKQKCW
jgi:Leucine-rich repeat (LRR) protein